LQAGVSYLYDQDDEAAMTRVTAIKR